MAPGGQGAVRHLKTAGGAPAPPAAVLPSCDYLRTIIFRDMSYRLFWYFTLTK